MTDTAEPVDLDALGTEGLERLKLLFEVQKTETEAATAAHEAELKKLELERDVERREAFLKDHADRVYFFANDVDGEAVEIARETLWRWHRHDPGSNITFVITSWGGSVQDGFALFDDLRTLSSLGHHVTTVVRGIAASMAGVLSQAGDTRLIGAESQMHVHAPAAFKFGQEDTWSAQDSHERLQATMHHLVDVYMRRAQNITRDELLQRFHRKDFWVSAQEALHFGFVDAIG